MENKTIAQFCISMPPRTKKNHQRILISPKSGKPFIAPSSDYAKYAKAAGWYIRWPNEPIKEPVNVRCLFYMPTRRRCDLTNLLEAIDDVLVAAGVLKDDDFTVVAGHDGSRVLYDKERPRTEVVIERIGEGA